MFLFPKSYAIAGTILDIAEWSSLFHEIKPIDDIYCVLLNHL